MQGSQTGSGRATPTNAEQSQTAVDPQQQALQPQRKRQHMSPAFSEDGEGCAFQPDECPQLLSCHLDHTRQQVAIELDIGGTAYGGELHRLSPQGRNPASARQVSTRAQSGP